MFDPKYVQNDFFTNTEGVHTILAHGMQEA